MWDYWSQLERFQFTSTLKRNRFWITTLHNRPFQSYLMPEMSLTCNTFPLIWLVSHWDSFWHRGKRQLVRGLLVWKTRATFSSSQKKAKTNLDTTLNWKLLFIWSTLKVYSPYQSVMKLVKLLRSSYHTARDRLGLNGLKWNFNPFGRFLCVTWMKI